MIVLILFQILLQISWNVKRTENKYLFVRGTNLENNTMKSVRSVVIKKLSLVDSGEYHLDVK